MTATHLRDSDDPFFYPYVTTFEKPVDGDSFGWRVVVVRSGVVLEDYRVLNLGVPFYCTFADLLP